MNVLRMLALAAVLAAQSLALAAGQTRFETIYTFTGAYPYGLTIANRVLYGLEATTGCGSIFALQPPPATGGAWTENTIYTFAGTPAGPDGCYPSWGPLPGPNGALYGLTSQGGVNGSGVLYELQPSAPGGAWSESVLYNFAGVTSGGGNLYPTFGLLPGPNGSFYGLGYLGATGGIAQLLPPVVAGAAWTGTLACTLPLASGPTNSFTMDASGAFFMTTAWGPSSAGALGQAFQLKLPATPGAACTQTLLHNFSDGNKFAGNPNALMVAGDGTLYGSTYGYDLSGAAGTSVVYSLTPPANPALTYTILKDFGMMGDHPDTPLLFRNGNLYGAMTTSKGGAVFEVQPPTTTGGAWTTTYLHSFTNGQMPVGTLVMDEGGTIYGVTQAAYGQPVGGTIYRIALP